MYREPNTPRQLRPLHGRPPFFIQSQTKGRELRHISVSELAARLHKSRILSTSQPHVTMNVSRSPRLHAMCEMIPQLQMTLHRPSPSPRQTITSTSTSTRNFNVNITLVLQSDFQTSTFQLPAFDFPLPTWSAALFKLLPSKFEFLTSDRPQDRPKQSGLRDEVRKT